jgi:hypothetical protein
LLTILNGDAPYNTPQKACKVIASVGREAAEAPLTGINRSKVPIGMLFSLRLCSLVGLFSPHAAMPHWSLFSKCHRSSSIAMQNDILLVAILFLGQCS